MKKVVAGVLSWVMIIMIMFPSGVIAADTTEQKNDYPIVLVNGFMGWGRDEMLDFKYWGGFKDIQQMLRDEGFEVYTAEVGPFSSNWDRACELYAYIKGGKVDYGKAHAEKHGHERYGRTYPGIYPKWGEIDPVTGKLNKIHVIGHSMGGQTIRTLVQLLKEGSAEEINKTPEDKLNPLFEGEHSWVHSITSISTPHDGTTLADEKNCMFEYAKDAISALGTASGMSDDCIFDFKLDQWGLHKEDYETSLEYINRVRDSSIWDENNVDCGLWDSTTKGAMQLNKWVKTQPNVYYFSWTTVATKSELLTGHQIPVPGVMNPIFYTNALIMGKFNCDEESKIDKSWWPNDGVVNEISQNGPKLGVKKPKIVEWDEIPEAKEVEKGVWNHMPTLEDVDHEDIIINKGCSEDIDIEQFYSDLGSKLLALPSDKPINEPKEILGNNFPVVLCHGFGGWGRNEKLGFKYWGGDTDIQEELRDEGYNVYTGVVGPLSSNWDRACELYAYIKGGTVDYGEEHAIKYGHERYGRTFDGLYPEWGEKDENGNIKKIHLIGHSQGGQTVRMLVQLLADDRLEQRGDMDKQDSLFAEKKSWVQSVTTLATPNDGTSLAEAGGLFDELINDAFTLAGGITGITDEINYLDLKLDQWGLKKEDNEFVAEYLYRVKNSQLLNNTKDISVWDLSIDAAKEANEWVREQPDVYYFSWSAMATRRSFLSGYQVPQPGVMNPRFALKSIIMGRYEGYTQGNVEITEKWFPNDGYVNTISEDGPKIGREGENPNEYIIDYDGEAYPGKWNDMGTLTATDHEDLIGRDTSVEMGGDVVSWYIDYLEILKNLQSITEN